jgi:eukaryotic-like serine/threonine-protein kinase
MSEALKAGAVLAGKYLIERVLGCGGMGVVVAATHIELRAPRAIKLPQPFGSDHEVSAERFLREATITARLTSEHVVRIHDGGKLPGGAPYIVMERLDGCDLGDLVQRGGRLPPEDAALYVSQACAAMEEAHALGILHLDLKPANLFLTVRSDGTPCVKVLDFGIARCADEPLAPARDRVEGSPAYMAPEQAMADRAIGPQADVWALGVILYELVTGRAPFRANTLAATFSHVLNREPAPAAALRPDLPPGLAAIISRCLNKSPDRRFADAAALRAALAPFAEAAGRVWLPEVGQGAGSGPAGWFETVKIARAAGRDDARAFEATMTLDDDPCSTAQADLAAAVDEAHEELFAADETGDGDRALCTSPMASTRGNAPARAVTSVGEVPGRRQVGVGGAWAAWGARRPPVAIP